MIRAVFFDVGNTLIYPYPSVGDIYSRIARKYDMVIDARSVEVSFSRVFTRQNDPPMIEESSEREWWEDVVREVISSLCKPYRFESFFDELYQFFIEAEAWRIYPDVNPLLDELRGGGMLLGVISNWDSRLIPLLDNLNLSTYFSVITVSALIGSAKPDPAIFEHALEKANVRPDEAIHVGDNVNLDFFGAKGCEMKPVLIDRKNDSFNPSVSPTIRSLEDLPPWIR